MSSLSVTESIDNITVPLPLRAHATDVYSPARQGTGRAAYSLKFAEQVVLKTQSIQTPPRCQRVELDTTMSRSTRTTTAPHRTGPSKKGTKQNSQQNQVCYCLICNQVIIDQSPESEGHESIFCEGKCQGWMHKGCAGLPKHAFELYSDSTSTIPFQCPHCKSQAQDKEISELKAIIQSLSTEITLLKSTQIAPESASPSPTSPIIPSTTLPLQHASSSYSNALHSSKTQANLIHSRGKTNLNDSNPDRKFQIVIYGLDECTKGTPRHVRTRTDLNSVTKTIQSICPELTDQSICDCIRLGRYSDDRHRPVLTKLVRSCDASNILANRRKLSNFPGISIKPLMTLKERKTELTLLRQRRALIDSGVSKSSIKIRGNAIYTDNTKHGTASESVFTLCNPSITQPSTDSNPTSANQQFDSATQPIPPSNQDATTQPI